VVVKNTFIDVVDGAEPIDPVTPTKRLPPALDFIPAEVSIERLEAFRLDYQRFRTGSALGARGEVSRSVAGEQDGDDEEDALSSESQREGTETGPACNTSAATAAAAVVPPSAGTIVATAGACGSLPIAVPEAPEAAQAAPVAMPAASPTAKLAAAVLASNAFSSAWTVKNSFLELEEDGNPCDDEFLAGASLPPPLGIIPGDVSLEKLITYRLDYLRFRAGFATGARGEVESSLQAD
jgi:hypothetical protein